MVGLCILEDLILIDYSKASIKITSDLKNSNLLKKMSQKGKIIDGKGAQRIATEIIKLANPC